MGSFKIFEWGDHVFFSISSVTKNNNPIVDDAGLEPATFAM